MCVRTNSGDDGVATHLSEVHMKKLLDILDRILMWVAGGLLCLMVSVVLLQVAMRYVFNAPTAWSEELATLLFVWMTMLGIPIALRHQQHIAIDLLAQKSRSRLKKGLRISSNLFFLGTFAAVAYLSIKILPAARRQNISGISDALGINFPLSVTYIAVTVGAVFAIVFAIEKMFEHTQTGEEK